MEKDTFSKYFVDDMLCIASDHEFDFRWNVNQDTWHEYLPAVKRVPFDSPESFRLVSWNWNDLDHPCECWKSVSLSMNSDYTVFSSLYLMELAHLRNLEELTVTGVDYNSFRDANGIHLGLNAFSSVGDLACALPRLLHLTIECEGKYVEHVRLGPILTLLDKRGALGPVRTADSFW